MVGLGGCGDHGEMVGWGGDGTVGAAGGAGDDGGGEGGERLDVHHLDRGCWPSC